MKRDLKILRIIGNGRTTGVEILKQLNIKQSLLSFQMAKLVKSGMVKAEEVWKWTYYSVDNEAVKESGQVF